MGLAVNQSVYADNTQILARFGAGDSERKVIWEPKLVQHGTFTLATHYSGFLQSLRMKVQIRSIAEIPIPPLPPEMGRVERAKELRDMEWRNPRKEIRFLMANGDDNFYHLFSVSLQNRLPYYTVDLLSQLTANADFLLAPESKLAAQVINAGWGLLDGEDEVVFYGAVSEEAYYFVENLDDFSTQCENYQVAVSGVSELIKGSNPQRKSMSLINDSPYRVWLSFGREAEIGRGILLNGGGSSYSIGRSNYYNGSVYAISEGNSNVVGVECSS